MIERMKSLIQYLNEASDAYYNRNDPIMSDKEWDRLFDELKTLEGETGIIMSNSPTQNVGFEVKSELRKVTHSSPMMSLDKTKDLGVLQNYCKGRPCVLSLKMDGLTIRLTYENGDLVLAETRGNGEVGEDVTHNARQIKNIPLKINHPDRYVIEGECIITYGDFEKINAELPEEKKFKNPRNLASGSVRQLDSKVARERNLKFVAWKVVDGDPSNSYGSRLMNADENLGFEVVPRIGYTDSEYIKQSHVDRLKEIAEEYGYPIDGLVLAHNDIAYGESLGMTGHHPRHSLAFKFSDDIQQSILRNIEWSMGKTGELTPVAIFDPVELEGTEVSRASLHNLTILKETLGDKPFVGQEIEVYKANAIIPAIKKRGK